MQALVSVINDSAGLPLFDSRTAAAGFPLSATIQSITDYPGDSITDQVDSMRSGHQLQPWKIAVITVTVTLGLIGTAAIAFVACRRKHMFGVSARKTCVPQVCLPPVINISTLHLMPCN